MAAYQPNQPYKHNNIHRLVRDNVPPPEFSTDSGHKNTVTFNRGAQFLLTTEKYGDPDLIAELSKCQPLELEHVMISWQYHQKALAQQILPFLFLGPMSVARDPKAIQEHGITMLLAVRDGTAAAVNPKIMNPARFASAAHIETTTFDVMNELDLVQRFPSVIKLMIDHLKARTNERPVKKLEDVGGRILVFCEAGDKRSAALVVLFFMVVFGLGATEAVQAVQARRYGIVVNGEYFRLIKNYGDVLQAERQVATNPVINIAQQDSGSSGTHKRNIDQAWDGDETMEGVKHETEIYRLGTAPFKDV